MFYRLTLIFNNCFGWFVFLKINVCIRTTIKEHKCMLSAQKIKCLWDAEMFLIL